MTPTFLSTVCRPHRRRRAVAAASVLALGFGLVAVASTQASAATSCSATYTTQSQWQGGFVANVTVTNNGTSALSGWTVTFTFGGDQKVTNAWNATVSQSGESVTAANLSYNGNVAAGSSTSFGFQGTWTNGDAAPASLTCTPAGSSGGGGSPSVVASPTSLSVTQGSAGTFSVTLSAAPTSNVTVSVSRTAGNTGLSVSAGGTLTFSSSNWNTPQNVTVSADSSSTGSATFTASSSGYTAATVTVTETASSGGGGGSGSAPQLHVSGNKLVDSNGNQVILRGVNRSGGEYACVQGNGLWDGPMDQTAVSAIKSWRGVNAVRVPLNEACWNGESYVNSAYSGTNYINSVKTYVNLLNAGGLVAILDLHWTDGTYTGPSSGCSSAQATCQKPMPDAAQAIPFWTSVANTFKGNDAVIFDLFNEPYASRATGNTTTGWQCWENGGTCSGISYQVAGMQQMVDAVRSTGANNVLLLGGEEYSNDLTSWLQFEPADPDHNLVASWHSYNFNTCSNQSCWTGQIAPVIAQVPVVAGEIGENDCAGSYITPLMTWLDSQNTSYLAWAWNADFNCSSGPGLISDYSGTPTAYGAAYQAHLASLP
ncbi:MAG: cellulase family glycosylhydrolase [Micromonosporaceae bacterium]